MDLFKFWKKSGSNTKGQQKKGSFDGQDGRGNPEGHEPNLQDARTKPERMSVSRSGRYKNKERRRSSLFQNPGLSIPEDDNTAKMKTGSAVTSNDQQLYYMEYNENYNTSNQEEYNENYNTTNHEEYNENYNTSDQEADLANRNIDLSTQQKRDQKLQTVS